MYYDHERQARNTNILKSLGIESVNSGLCRVQMDRYCRRHNHFYSPADGSAIAGVKQGTRADYEMLVSRLVKPSKNGG
jgi:hypothetical protein